MSQPDFKIIVIDDNPEIHKDFKKVLTVASSDNADKLNQFNKQLFGDDDTEKKSGNLPLFQIDTATQGKEGVQKIADAIQSGNPYSLAFVDIRMPPGWDGIETIKHIWELDKDIQVVICTAYSDYSWEETIQELGQTDNLLILKKPFDHIAVRQLACALTRKWSLMQESRSYTKSLEKSVQERTNLLQESLSITRATFESSADGILVINLEGKIIDYNNQFMTLCQIPNELLEKKEYKAVISYLAEETQNPQDFLNKTHKIDNQIQEVNLSTLIFKDGRTIERYTQPHKLNDQIIGRVYSFRDVTERVNLQNELEWQATHDILTGLPNRVLLIDRIQQEIANADRNQLQFAILFFDIDRFKLINDSLGHEIGDEILKLFAKRIQAKVRACDTFARLGGDEFVMLLSQLPHNEFVAKIASQLLAEILIPFKLADRELSISSSIGISIYPIDGANYDTLIGNADVAMYIAKQSGANQFQFYTNEMNQRNIMRLEMESGLRKAIENHELILYYQPQISMDSNKLVVVEVLIRWNHPKKGILLPMDFMPIAENTGLMVPISEWALKEACLQIKSWQEAGLPLIRLAFNVPSSYFNQPYFVKNIKKILTKSKLEPQYLELILTENLIINNVDAANIISGLKEIGVIISMGDFGVNFSNLNYLGKLRFDRLKMDPAFLQSLKMNNGGGMIMSAILAMAKNLNLEVITEGKNNENQFLTTDQYNEVQELYFSKPLNSLDLENILKNENMIDAILSTVKHKTT